MGAFRLPLILHLPTDTAWFRAAGVPVTTIPLFSGRGSGAVRTHSDTHAHAHQHQHVSDEARGSFRASSSSFSPASAVAWMRDAISREGSTDTNTDTTTTVRVVDGGVGSMRVLAEARWAPEIPRCATVQVRDRYHGVPHKLTFARTHAHFHTRTQKEREIERDARTHVDA